MRGVVRYQFGKDSKKAQPTLLGGSVQNIFSSNGSFLKMKAVPTI